MRLQFQGAVQTVTGSRTLIESDGQQFLIDCGMFQGPKPIRLKNWQPIENASKIKAVVLTHAHIDHSGLLPLLWKSGFRGKIYSSAATAELCQIMLLDAAKIQEEDAHFANVSHHSRHIPALPLFTIDDAEKCLELFVPTEYHKWFNLTDQLSFRLSRSAHILGSSFVELHHSTENKRILFSGDLGNNRSLILKEAETVSECDTLVMESTYGDRVLAHNDILEKLADAICKTMARKGTLIIPAFSVGRTQEMLYMIQLLSEQGKIPTVPVYLDSPMSLRATAIYQKFENELKQEIRADRWESVSRSMQFIAVASAEDSMLLCMNDEPKVVISAAGMLNGGRVLHHLRRKLPDPRSCVLFVGYQVPGTKGYLLRNKLGKIRIHHELVDVEAEIVDLDSLSAHADSNELVKWVSDLKVKPKRIFINHGEVTAMEALSYRLRVELGMEVILPVENQFYDL
jgi:metallo-beta-lactamase family protein